LPNLLLQKISQLLSDKKNLLEMEKAAKNFSKEDASLIIAQETLKLII